MAAAHRIPTTFEMTMLRRRKRPSGMSGEGTRASMPMKNANSTTAAARSPSVWPVAQPVLLPFTIA